MKIFIKANLDYVMGYLRHGHKEGYINIPKEDYELFKQNPIDYVELHDLADKLELIIDDYRVEDYGSIDSITFNIITDDT